MSEMRPRVLLSVQRALVGNIVPAIRAALVQIDGNRATVRIVIDGPVSDQLLEMGSDIEAEMTADFLDSFTVSVTVERMDAPAPMPRDNCVWVFARRES